MYQLIIYMHFIPERKIMLLGVFGGVISHLGSVKLTTVYGKQFDKDVCHGVLSVRVYGR